MDDHDISTTQTKLKTIWIIDVWLKQNTKIFHNSKENAMSRK